MDPLAPYITMLSGSSSVSEPVPPFYLSPIPRLYPPSIPALSQFPPLVTEFDSDIVEQTSLQPLFLTCSPSDSVGNIDEANADEDPHASA
ncbi:hypothetical protein V6N12_065641 [Hibiscus sabdariffa]|uniref:Uncharacterized protein n=1 Tax=Hibiscus sabdariffa TaxID=183260 RepID=A0ABR2G9A9_9ROSI